MAAVNASDVGRISPSAFPDRHACEDRRPKRVSCGPLPSPFWDVHRRGTDWIVEINPDSGKVTAAMDMTTVVPPSERGNPDHVLNGIAAIPATINTFLLTGKQWATMYRVRFGA
jgi:Glutamine cyclotransferase